MVLALGVALMFTGLVTHWVISLLGFRPCAPAMVGWFFEVFPHEQHVAVLVQTGVVKISSTRTTREQLAHRRPNIADCCRSKPFSISSGIKGGIAGGIAMVMPAALFGLLSYHSIWYAVNLLAAGGFVSWAARATPFSASFTSKVSSPQSASTASPRCWSDCSTARCCRCSRRKPIVTAGFVAPLLWTGILHSALGVISPILNDRIDWLWFVVSQIAFGLVCGFVVNLQVKVRTPQFRSLPFAVRAGIHSDAPSAAKDDQTNER